MAEENLVPSDQEIADEITLIAKAKPSRHIGWRVPRVINGREVEFHTGVFGDEWLGWTDDRRLAFVKGLLRFGVKRGPRPMTREESDAYYGIEREKNGG